MEGGVHACTGTEYNPDDLSSIDHIDSPVGRNPNSPDVTVSIELVDVDARVVTSRFVSQYVECPVERLPDS